MVESAALEMRCTHYVVPGVRIPHSPQQEERMRQTLHPFGFQLVTKIFYFLKSGQNRVKIGSRISSTPSLKTTNICIEFASESIRGGYRQYNGLPDNIAYPCTTPSDF